MTKKEIEKIIHKASLKAEIPLDKLEAKIAKRDPNVMSAEQYIDHESSYMDGLMAMKDCCVDAMVEAFAKEASELSRLRKENKQLRDTIVQMELSKHSTTEAKQ